jgi:hypothetical protein
MRLKAYTFGGNVIYGIIGEKYSRKIDPVAPQNSVE